MINEFLVELSLECFQSSVMWIKEHKGQLFRL